MGLHFMELHSHLVNTAILLCWGRVWVYLRLWSYLLHGLLHFCCSVTVVENFAVVLSWVILLRIYKGVWTHSLSFVSIGHVRYCQINNTRLIVHHAMPFSHTATNSCDGHETSNPILPHPQMFCTADWWWSLSVRPCMKQHKTKIISKDTLTIAMMFHSSRYLWCLPVNHWNRVWGSAATSAMQSTLVRLLGMSSRIRLTWESPCSISVTAACNERIIYWSYAVLWAALKQHGQHFESGLSAIACIMHRHTIALLSVKHSVQEIHLDIYTCKTSYSVGRSPCSAFDTLALHYPLQILNSFAPCNGSALCLSSASRQHSSWYIECVVDYTDYLHVTFVLCDQCMLMLLVHNWHAAMLALMVQQAQISGENDVEEPLGKHYSRGAPPFLDLAIWSQAWQNQDSTRSPSASWSDALLQHQ